jgi:hypothetical protein
MGNPVNNPLLLSRPKDESLEAFKEFTIEVCRHLGIAMSEEFLNDEERWDREWKRFWNIEEPGEEGKLG